MPSWPGKNTVLCLHRRTCHGNVVFLIGFVRYRSSNTNRNSDYNRPSENQSVQYSYPFAIMFATAATATHLLHDFYIAYWLCLLSFLYDVTASSALFSAMNTEVRERYLPLNSVSNHLAIQSDCVGQPNHTDFWMPVSRYGVRVYNLMRGSSKMKNYEVLE